MNARLTFRSLLTTTSMAALIVASHGARAATYDNPYGNTLDQIYVSTTVPYVSNAGTITNEYGEDGIEVYDTTVGDSYSYSGSVTNTGSISVNDREEGDDALRGILVDDATIWGDIDNSGSIAVTAAGSGNGESSRYAAGIEFGGSSLTGSIYNSGSIDVDALVTNVDGYCEDDLTSLSAAAEAYGINADMTDSGRYNGSIQNTGSVNVHAASKVDQSASDETEEGAYAEGNGHATAYAAGVEGRHDGTVDSDHRGPYIASNVYLSSYENEGINVAATAQSFTDVSATVTCDGSGESCYGEQYAEGNVLDNATAQAYGVKLVGNSAVVGDIYNDATIDVYALAETHSVADADAPDGSARAYAGYREDEHDEYYETSTASAAATGINVDVLQVKGDVESYENINAHAVANGQSTATGTAPGYVEAAASNAAYAGARGILVDTLLVSGDFTNGASSVGTAEANSTTKATANSGADGEAWADSAAHANAAGIDIAADALGGTFTNENEGYWDGDEFYGDIVKGEAVAHAIASATTVGGEYSDAWARGGASAQAYGINANVEAIAGHFINEGVVEAKAEALGDQKATVSNDESLDAFAGGELHAAATGIQLGGDTLAGSFYNDGTVVSSASSIGVSTAIATGLDDILAVAGNFGTATARGIAVAEEEIQDSVLNDGNIRASANVDLTQVATATANEEGEGDAAALSATYDGDGVPTSGAASATGLYVSSADIGGNVVNSGQISVDATVGILSTVDATATNDGDAWSGATSTARAEAYGLRARIGDLGYGNRVDEDNEYGNGYFVNESLIDVHAGVNISETVTSVADDGNAGAAALLRQGYDYCYDDCGEDGGAVAYGIALGDNEEGADLDGDFLNFGTVVAAATAVATLNATATVDDGEDTSALVAAGGALASNAFGISIENVDSNGEFYNDANISAIAHTEMNADAYADSDDGPAFALVGSSIPYDLTPDFSGMNSAYASATGVDINESYFDDGFWNDGRISAAAFADAKATSEARGDEQALAFAGNSANAQAVGVSISNSSFDDDFVNQGAIAGIAASTVETDVFAHGDTAFAYLSNDGDAAQSSATATGLSVYGGSYGVSIYNGTEDYEEGDGFSFDIEEGDGQIWALAGAFGDNSATAEGDTVAYADARNSEYAESNGIYASGSYYGGNLTNYGLIVSGALAVGNESAEATADGHHSEATAYASDRAEADALGIEMVASSISNTGAIFAGAGAISNVSAYAEGGDAEATASASADASATGILMSSGYSSNAALTNSGQVQAFAYAKAHAEAVIDYSGDEEDSSANATANASAAAYGVWVSEYSTVSEIYNSEDGVISATAVAEATLGDDEEDLAYGHSNAYAVALGVNDAAFGTIVNEGEIRAQATARAEASAIGVLIDGNYNTVSGTLTNSGTISAYASGENPYATAIMLWDGAMVSEISNTGDILAESEDTSEIDLFGMDQPQAVAIDVRGGTGTTIQQLDGRILGAILMDNEYRDTLNWSGGTINGDIYGNHIADEEGGDTLNVFAGEDDSFTYSGAISGLDAFNVNGGEHTSKVALRLTGTTTNVGNFHVGPNATVTIGTAADIGTENLDLNAAATLAFELTTDGANGVINTETADLGGATVKGVFLDAGLPVNQTYRIINWDGSDSRFGNVSSNSLIEKIVAQYGEDGVDLLVTRLSFADVAGLKDDGTSFGKALDRVIDGIDPDSDLGKAIYQLILLTPEEYSKAMNEIAGQQTADVQSITFSQAGSLIHVIQTQLSELRGGTIASADANSLGIRVASNQLVATMSDAPQPGMGAAGTKLSGDWSAWARIFGDWAELDRSNVAAGFTSTTGGVIAGADYSFSPNLIAGLAAGYQSSDMDFRGTGKGDISSWSLTAYGDYRMGAIYIDALAGYAKQSYDMDRYLTVLGTGYVANSDYDGSSIIGSIETGYEVALSEGAKLTPFAGINFTHTKTDAVTETGAGIWNLAYEDRSENGIDSVFGVRLSKSFVTDDGMKLTPMVELGWKHAFGDTSPIANAALAGTPGSNFQIFGSTAKRDTAIVGAALSAQMTDTIDAYVQYNGQYSSNYMDNTASLRLRWKF